MKIVVLGAGAWGTAVASAAAGSAGNAVTLWARDPAAAAALVADGQNRRYLPDVALPAALAVCAGPAAPLVAQADLVVLATPIAALRGMLETLADHPGPVAWLCKGFEPGRGGAPGLLPHEICAQVAPRLRAGALSGPSFALEVARGQPTALVAASADAGVRAALVEAFHGPALRIYANDDVLGVEVGGAVKNVLAIATGLCDGLQLGLNARAALVTRGLAEMTRLGLALGARADTFMGLSGMGDLVLTATGNLSRNRRVGLLLAEGRTLQQAVDSLGHVAEGVYCARTVVQRARVVGVEMPIAEGVVALLDGQAQADAVVAALMGRGPAVEVGG
ncbi:NAD(P)H-dependent glycerol-3-phosphate dehydrogenase [Xylophilus sp. Leaf220]|uniref:NAD(P)H-dependent glycerol-3-phosphate dehydrogenase n=1 Tax=Xylophilus sp. Leaf220 TaxID=1735686 RepID=UPI0006F756F3|nr:NAD(P)H-dependent glycerol-3-phosphate dehydrogenase [Xylophilus sp. Leaf220]KQM80279.1 glycerol-3-phosphate dehydrogenase [Xylophilus sp. Leaf220]